MIEIDGSIGGGSVVRLAVGLSAATMEPVTITNIRSTRSTPGLRPQHCTGIDGVRQLVQAEVEGCEIESTEITFTPREMTGDRITVSLPTAGSTALILQPLHIAAAGIDSRVRVRIDGGATAGKWAPPLTTYDGAVCPLAERFGIPASIDIRRHGFYPKGGALVTATYGPASPTTAELTARGDVQHITGLSVASQHLADADVAERQRQAARRTIADQHPAVDMDIETRTVETRSPGSFISLVARCEDGILAGDALGEEGKRSEAVGREAAESLLTDLETGAAVDRQTADQLVPFLGLVGGAMRVPAVTDHLTTNIAVTDRFIDGTIREEEGVVQVTRP